MARSKFNQSTPNLIAPDLSRMNDYYIASEPAELADSEFQQAQADDFENEHMRVLQTHGSTPTRISYNKYNLKGPKGEFFARDHRLEYNKVRNENLDQQRLQIER